MLEVVAGILMRCGQLFEDVQQLCVNVCIVSCPISEDGTISVPKQVGCVQVLTDINIGLIFVYEF